MSEPDCETWTNWSGNQTATLAEIVMPDSLNELRQAVKTAREGVRVVGAGHSFTPIVATTGRLICLDRLGGVRSADPKAHRARIGAGGRLRDLSPALGAHGLAFRNLGDIDAQSLAGAVATATHGTGRTLPCLGADIRAATLVTASGDLVEVSREATPDLLDALQVSLGLLGVVAEFELDLVASFRLRRRTWVEASETLQRDAHRLWQAHRNFEFFRIPFSGRAICVAHDVTEAPPTPRAQGDDDGAVMALKHIRDKAGGDTEARRNRLASALDALEGEDVVDTSWRLLANSRNVGFNEMEYHLPGDIALDVLEDVVARIERHRPDVFFPVEVRRTAGDSAWLSPFQGGERISIAVHAYHEDPYDWMFDLVEPVLRAAGGRPHWGKLHSLGWDDIGALYPDAERFRALRREFDPAGRFLNPYLARLMGEAVAE